MSKSSSIRLSASPAASTRPRDGQPVPHRHANVNDVLRRLQREGLSVRRVAGTIGTREYVIDLKTPAD